MALFLKLHSSVVLFASSLLDSVVLLRLDIVCHAAVAHLDVEFVADLMQSVMVRKVFSEQSQEFLADVGFDMLAKWWNKPHDVCFPLFLFLEAKVFRC